MLGQNFGARINSRELCQDAILMTSSYNCLWPALNQGRGRRLLKFSYLDHPTKSDVTSGLNWAAQLVSQSEKMAFRFAKIFFYLQPIRLVSFQTEGGKMLQAHSFDFETKTFGKRQHFIIVLKENNWEPSVIEWRILHICETDVVPTFGCCCSWLSDNTKWNSAWC